MFYIFIGVHTAMSSSDQKDQKENNQFWKNKKTPKQLDLIGNKLKMQVTDKRTNDWPLQNQKEEKGWERKPKRKKKETWLRNTTGQRL